MDLPRSARRIAASLWLACPIAVAVVAGVSGRVVRPGRHGGAHVQLSACGYLSSWAERFDQRIRLRSDIG
jgi:hypothetical protein